MGTNFYARYNLCKCCNRFDELHIGKSSAGWTFSFHATDNIKSWKQWREFLSLDNVVIHDEYGDVWSLKEFEAQIENKKLENNNHARQYPEDSFLDEEGNSFSEGEFS